MSSKIEMVNQVKLDNESEEMAVILENWRMSWEAKNINEYISFYHDKFYSGSKKSNQWKIRREEWRMVSG